jgi:hypothetical protein
MDREATPQAYGMIDDCPELRIQFDHLSRKERALSTFTSARFDDPALVSKRTDAWEALRLERALLVTNVIKMADIPAVQPPAPVPAQVGFDAAMTPTEALALLSNEMTDLEGRRIQFVKSKAEGVDPAVLSMAVQALTQEVARVTTMLPAPILDEETEDEGDVVVPVRSILRAQPADKDANAVKKSVSVSEPPTSDELSIPRADDANRDARAEARAEAQDALEAESKKARKAAKAEEARKAAEAEEAHKAAEHAAKKARKVLSRARKAAKAAKATEADKAEEARKVQEAQAAQDADTKARKDARKAAQAAEARKAAEAAKATEADKAEEARKAAEAEQARKAAQAEQARKAAAEAARKRASDPVPSAPAMPVDALGGAAAEPPAKRARPPAPVPAPVRPAPSSAFVDLTEDD